MLSVRSICNDLRKDLADQPRQGRSTAHVSRPQTSRICCHAPQPFKAQFLCNNWRTDLRARDEIKGTPDADKPDMVQAIEAARGKNFLLWCAQRDKTYPRSGLFDLIYR